MDNSEQDVILRLESMLRRVVREELSTAFPHKAPRARKPTIQLNGVGFLGISDEHMAAWRAAYPGVQIEAELAKAAAWCKSNPQKCPKARYDRFLNSWISRAHKPERVAPRRSCAHCGGSLAAGHTAMQIGDVCGKCWDGYMQGNWR